MSAVSFAGTAMGDVAWSSVRTLAAIEARRYATRASLWVGWAATVLAAATQRTDWPGGAYESVIPMSFSFMVLGVFVAGARTGSRDADRDLPALADEAALEGGDRLAARLLGLAMPVGLALLTTLGIAVASWIEGGFWMGEGSRRSDTALHSALELLQPTLLVALAGAVGVVAGRATHRTVLVIIAGVFVWMLMFPLYWIWNSPPLHVLAPVQTMPLRVELHDVVSIDETPAGWYVEYPNDYGRTFARDLVHMPTVALHDLYLIGLILIVGAAAGRAHRHTLRMVGIGLAVAGVAGQLAVSPF